MSLKFKYILIRGYKNLKSVTLDFTPTDGRLLLIGTNGSGKSNLLEAISSIFAGLYRAKFHKPQFDYTVEYCIGDKSVYVDLTSGNYTIKVDGNLITKTDLEQNSAMYLPKNIIACYSGDNQRMWDNYYSRYYKLFAQDVRKATTAPLPLMYVSKYNITIALLTLFFYDLSQFTDIKEFCERDLDIRTLESIDFIFNTENIGEWEENAVLNSLAKLCAVSSYRDLPKSLNITLEELRSRLGHLHEGEFYMFLYSVTMPKDSKIVDSINLKIRLNNGAEIGVESMSEGEQRYVLFKAIYEALGTEDSLVIFDEPDSHLHISRKGDLLPFIEKYPTATVMATHSPTLAKTFDEKNIIGLQRKPDGVVEFIAQNKISLLSSLTDGIWTLPEQNIFLASNKPMTLLVEGKTDKMHIQEAWKRLGGNYPDLDFDVFSMNSSEHIREVLIGMSCSEIVWEKKFVGIFDNDTAGVRDIANGFEAESRGVAIKHVKYKDGVPSTSFYAFLLPKSPGYQEKESFTIENMYPAQRYEEAYVQAVHDKKGYFDNLSIDSIADDLKNKSKIIMAANVQSYQDADFESFKMIFDLLQEIHNK